jgi:hypothetical protein
MTIYGWDMSHYDGSDPKSAVSEGYRFITHKAGGDANDPEIATWWGKVRNYTRDVLLGAYWVQYPGSPASRADQFLARLDATCPGWRSRDAFILQLDCEKWGGDSSTVPKLADIKAFCDRLVAKTEGVYRPIVYAPEWVYGDSLKGLGYPLWASSYVSGSGTGSAMYAKAGGDNSSKWGAYSGQVPAILQFSSSVTIAGQTTCDANAYRGTLDQLKALVTPGKDHDMPLTGADAATVWNADIIANPAQRGDSPKHTPAGTNASTSATYALGDIWAQVYNLRDAVASQGKAILAAVQAVAAKDSVDEVALARELAAGVAAAVLAGLPADRDDVSQEEVTAAVESAFREAFTPKA